MKTANPYTRRAIITRSIHPHLGGLVRRHVRVVGRPEMRHLVDRVVRLGDGGDDGLELVRELLREVARRLLAPDAARRHDVDDAEAVADVGRRRLEVEAGRDDELDPQLRARLRELRVAARGGRAVARERRGERDRGRARNEQRVERQRGGREAAGRAAARRR